ncbi:PIG-L deacetylase family protein [Flavivirga algicola]|uniref:PIG-L family deacetylase n=1 Tax=Flavivirga algicola TaxID=2729136 RepID=A0ABX1S137_9FLAO|nr:PIG-L family deacetylase [Flavivirga algicola]NMH89596.1 PIG-L family deacetylase [Flavivirga algicola]
MKIMYIFPHPDDESFGPAGAIDKQIKEGNKVVLLTLTKGGATKVRHQLGLSVQEMGAIREKEMLKVQKTLNISEMTILDYQDGRLAKTNPLHLEAEILKWLQHYQPNVVITYPVHGGSGHHDHIALHHIIKRLYFEKKEKLHYWKRLAYFTVIDTGKPMFFDGGIPRVTWTREADIVVTEKLDESNISAMKNALLCYDTYQEMVKTTNVIERIGNKTHFELENEKHNKILSSVTESITV